MRYNHSRAKSAEIMRMVVTRMARQEAGFHPASYALWYEHLAGVNPELSRALEKHTGPMGILTDSDVLRLYSQFIEERDFAATKRIRERLCALLKDTSRLMSDTGIHALQFGEALGGHSRRLRQSGSVEWIEQIVTDLLTETQRMRSENASMAREIESRAEEVRRLERRLEEVETEALQDALTGLLNRRGFERAVGALVSELAGAALIIVDIDRFKGINDAYTHVMGDQALKAVAQVLRARISTKGISARLGGDEFAVLMPNTSLAEAVEIAEQVRATLPCKRLQRVDGQGTIENVTVSVGVAMGGAKDTLQSLIYQTDMELYRAKRFGRNRVSVQSGAGSLSVPK